MDVSRTTGKVLSPNKGSWHSHSFLSRIVWHRAPLHIEAQLPTPQAQIYPPADGHSTCLLQSSMELFLPSHFHCSLGFPKQKENLTSVCSTYREWWFTLHGAKKENALVCEWREIHPVSLQSHKICQLIQTETFLSEGSQTGTFLGSAAGHLISFTYGVLFADRPGFNAIDTSTGKQLYLPLRDYQSHKSVLATG